MQKKDQTKSISGFTYSSLIDNHKELVEVDRKARDEGMTYGQYVAQQFLKTHSAI